MSEIVEFAPAMDYRKLAIDKINRELKDFKGDRYGQAVKDHVASTICHFCSQDNRFSEVVYKTKRTLSDCCREIMKGCGQHISDIDVYRGAVRNYFPNADIDFHMTITLTGDAPTEEEMNRVSEEPKPKEKKAPKKSAETKKQEKKVEKQEDQKPAAAEPPKMEAQKPAEAPKKKAPAPGAIKPASAIVPAKGRKKKDSSVMSDPNLIQLSLF